MLFDNSIVGPIHSRRLGASLGVNLLPLKHKRCSYDCIYCECGWNRETENEAIEFATPEKLGELLENRLKALAANNVAVDSLTFAGNGEPTLYPWFAEMVGIVTELRDKYYPKAMTTLLSNATQLKRPEIFEAVKRVDNPVLKLDAGTEGMWKLINKNNELGCPWDDLLANLTAFGSKGIIQTLLFDGTSAGRQVGNISDGEFNAYTEHLKKIGPRYVMLYALDRATPEKELRKLSVAELQLYAQKIRNEGIEVKVYG